MKAALMFFALMSFGAAAMAADPINVTADPNVPVVEYTYGTHLDVAKVISISEIPDVCEVVPARMVYEDSKGAEHILEYRVMGNGCANG